jgi:3-deoxy-7-phosphoheptulonate synthase
MMLVVLKTGAADRDVVTVVEKIESAGFTAHVSRGEARTVIGAVGVEGDRNGVLELSALECVEEVISISRPYKLASREFKKETTVIRVGPAKIGEKRLAIIAGPCSVEDEATMTRLADSLVELGCTMLRGGAFKPRSSPYSFQGLGEQGLRILRKV